MKQVYIPEALHSVLKRAAQGRGVSIQALVEDLLVAAVVKELGAHTITVNTIEELKRARETRTAQALQAITNARTTVDAVATCAQCNRVAPLPINAQQVWTGIEESAQADTQADTQVPKQFCSIGCAVPGASLPLSAFAQLENKVIAAADGSTGAIFFRATDIGKTRSRPTFCYRCGRVVSPGLKLVAPGPPRRTFCHKCLRPSDAWIEEWLSTPTSPDEPGEPDEPVEPVEPEEVEPEVVEEIIGHLRPVGEPLSDANDQPKS